MLKQRLLSFNNGILRYELHFSRELTKLKARIVANLANCGQFHSVSNTAIELRRRM